MRKSRRRKRRRRTRRKTTRRRRTRRERKTRTRTTTTTTTTSSSLASSSSLPSITTTTTRIQLVEGSKAWKTLSPKIQRLTDTNTFRSHLKTFFVWTPFNCAAFTAAGLWGINDGQIVLCITMCWKLVVVSAWHGNLALLWIALTKRANFIDSVRRFTRHITRSDIFWPRARNTCPQCIIILKCLRQIPRLKSFAHLCSVNIRRTAFYVIQHYFANWPAQLYS